MTTHDSILTKKRFDLDALRSFLLDDEAQESWAWDALFELYRWAVASTDAPPAWKRKNPGHPLYKGVRQSFGDAPFNAAWKKDLRRRLRAMLVPHRFNDKALTRWRADTGLDKATKTLSMLTYKWSVVADTLTRVFAMANPGRRTRHSYNNTYPDARHVNTITLTLREGGWVFALSYGIDGSSWTDDHTETPVLKDGALTSKSTLPSLRVTQGEMEPFVDFVERARKHYDAKVLTPACDTRRRTITRVGACSGWTGRIQQSAMNPISPEVIGGVKLDDYASKLDYDKVGYSPVLFAVGEHVAEVTVDLATERWALVKWRESRGRATPYGRFLPALTDMRAMLRARARFLLYAEWTKRAFLDLPSAEQGRAVNEIHAAKEAPAKVEQGLVYASMKGRPVAWHEAFSLRCNGTRCEP